MVDCDVMMMSFMSPAHPSPSSLSAVSGVMVMLLRPSAGWLVGFGEACTWALLSSWALTFNLKPCRILKISLGNGIVFWPLYQQMVGVLISLFQGHGVAVPGFLRFRVRFHVHHSIHQYHHLFSSMYPMVLGLYQLGGLAGVLVEAVGVFRFCYGST